MTALNSAAPVEPGSADGSLRPANSAVIGWHSIDSAPRKEGETLILWNGVAVEAGHPWESGWADSWLDWMNPQPTHWCPLPSAPVA